MNSATKELYVGAGMVVLALLGWFVIIPAGIDLPSTVEFRALSPDFWPHVVMVLLAVSGSIVAFQAYLELRDPDAVATSQAAEDADSEETLVEFEFGQRAVRVIAALIGMFAIYFLIPHIGIVVAGMVVILAVTFALGERRLKYTVPLAVLLPSLLYLFFVHVASVPMPLGVFEMFR